jgi:hypothetical protein
MPAGKNKQQEEMDIATPGMQENHVADFIKAVKAKDKSLLSCKIEDAFQSTTTVQLAMASYYTNSKVVWDADKLDIVGNKAASKLLARPYRDDYKRPKY